MSLIPVTQYGSQLTSSEITSILNLIAMTSVRDEVPTGSGTAFTLAHTPVANTLQLFRGGSRQQVGVGNDYTISGVNITLAVGLGNGEVLLADYSY